MPWVTPDDMQNRGVESDYIEVSVNPPSIAAGAEADVTVAVAGAAVGNGVVVQPPALTAGLGITLARVSAADTVVVRLRNFSAGAIDEAAANWRFWIAR